MNAPLITLSSDFAVQSQGVGAMEAVAYSIAPHARVIHLMHGIPGFQIIVGARTMETVKYFPIGFHVCVVDPGVGTSRKPIAIQVRRGDYLIGPDNGVLIPATRLLGGIESVHELRNPNFMRKPVSPIFHGRDVFTPAAAHLACGVPLSDFGPALEASKLVAAPYDDAAIEGKTITATVIHINHFGSVHLNILAESWDKVGIVPGDTVTIRFTDGRKILLPVVSTFGEVEKDQNLIMKDDYGRIEIAKNLGSFSKEYPLSSGDVVKIEW